MLHNVIESSYPIGFREAEAKELGRQLRNRHSVVMVGMKRVGISSFLRFFLYHKSTLKTYVQDNKRHLLIAVDLHDLVERELFPFWVLTFKRIVDAVEKLGDQSLQKKADTLFLSSIQANNLFLTIDNIRQVLTALVEKNIMPSIFFIRFDRILEVANQDFFSNIMGLQESTHQKLALVFTSYRSLHEISPQMFPRASLSVFAHELYIKPAKTADVLSVYETFKHKYRLKTAKGLEKKLFALCDGYIQYLQLALIILHEQKRIIESEDELKELLFRDERITLQSEELWESLTDDEKKVLLFSISNKKLLDKDKRKAKYLFDTGILDEKGTVFSELFLEFLKVKEKETKESLGELSKKEHTLFTLLQKQGDGICERELIVQEVWSEVEAFGVSDWAIDRLVARLRSKLKLQKSEFEIQTIKTRGYKLVKV